MGRHVLAGLIIIYGSLLAGPGLAQIDPPEPAFMCEGDWSGGETQLLEVYLSDDVTRGFVRLSNVAGREVVSPIYPMWTAMPARLVSGEATSLVLGVWSRVSRHDETEPHRAIWVVQLEGDAFVERWRGSALARPLLDWRAADLDGDGVDELITLETQEGHCFLTAYAWREFGFHGVASREFACGALSFCDGPPSADPTLCRGAREHFRARLGDDALLIDRWTE